MTWAEVTEVARMSRNYIHEGMEWFVAGREIWMGQQLIATTTDAAIARYIVRLHNVYLKLANAAIMLRTEAQDLRKALAVKRGRK